LALAYLNEPWDAISDARSAGLEDDLVVLGHVASVVVEMNSADETGESMGRVRNALKDAFKKRRRYPELGHILEVSLSGWTECVDFRRYSEKAVARLREVVVQNLNSLGWDGEKWVDWLAATPPAFNDSNCTTVALFGRTSSGKTTLARRFVAELATNRSRLSELLATCPRSHTTRIPLVLDFRPDEGTAWWQAAGPSLNSGGIVAHDASVVGNEEVLRRCSGRSADSGAAWLAISVPAPSSDNLRILDLPGTQGFAAGPWHRTGEHLLAGSDAAILPMDRRFFRDEEFTDLVTVLQALPARHVALALYWVDPALNPTTPDRFLSERIGQALAPGSARGGLSDEELDRICGMLDELSVFTVAATPGEQDDFPALLSWCANGEHWNPGPLTYAQLETRAQWQISYGTSVPVDVRQARLAMVSLGLLRAWMACQLTEESHVE